MLRKRTRRKVRGHKQQEVECPVKNLGEGGMNDGEEIEPPDTDRW